MVSNDMIGNSGPSPTGEKLSQILSGASSSQDPYSQNRQRQSQDQYRDASGFTAFEMNNQRGVSAGSRGSVGNTSHTSIGSMNYSVQGYGSDASGKGGMQGKPTDKPDGPQRNSSGGIEDLQVWLKQESNKKYE